MRSPLRRLAVELLDPRFLTDLLVDRLRVGVGFFLFVLFLVELVFFWLPEPPFFPPPDSLFTVDQAIRSALSSEVPRFLYDSSICSA